jgi:hypothetical protein
MSFLLHTLRARQNLRNSETSLAVFSTLLRMSHGYSFPHFAYFALSLREVCKKDNPRSG